MKTERQLISRAKLVIVLAKKFRNGMIHYDDLMAAIADIPTVDAVEVVRCKDCKHLGFKGLCDSVCNRKMVGIVKPDDFCSYGERREGE